MIGNTYNLPSLFYVMNMFPKVEQQSEKTKSNPISCYLEHFFESLFLLLLLFMLYLHIIYVCIIF